MTEADVRALREVVLDQLGTGESRAYKMWLPPLLDPTPLNELGAKGIGESGTIGSTPAVHNAVVDALAPFGVKHLDMPCTPEKVWRAINGLIEAPTVYDPPAASGVGSAMPPPSDEDVPGF